MIGELLAELPDVVLVLSVRATVFSYVLSPRLLALLLVIRDLPGCHAAGKDISGHHLVGGDVPGLNLVVVWRWLAGLLPWLLWKIRSAPGSSLCFLAPGRGETQA